MKLKDKFLELKNEYQDAIVLIKSGSFYLTYDEDAIILNFLFSYQISNTKVGFPLKNIEKVTDILKKEEISYVIFDEQLAKFLADNNKYNVIFNKAKKNEFNLAMNNMLIDRIKFLLEEKPEVYIKLKDFIDDL